MSNRGKSVISIMFQIIMQWIAFFQDAIAMMLELIRAESAAEGHDLEEDELQVKLLADLQQQQKKEAQKLLNDLEDKVFL